MITSPLQQNETEHKAAAAPSPLPAKVEWGAWSSACASSKVCDPPSPTHVVASKRPSGKLDSDPHLAVMREPPPLYMVSTETP